MKTSSHPKISVVLPVFNGAEFIEEAIKSILNQTFSDFQLFVIDDSSQDETANIVRTFHDERLLLVQNDKNLGLIDTLNRGLDLADGEYVARMDSDDIALPDRFEKQIRFLDAHPEIAVLGGAYETIEPQPRLSSHPLSPNEVKQELLFTGCVIAHPTVMMRRSALNEIGAKYDKNYIHTEDYALWAYLSTKVLLANLPDVVLKYRCHPNQASIRFASNQEDGSWRVRALLLAELVEQTPKDEAFQVLSMFFISKKANKSQLLKVSLLLKELVNNNRAVHVYDPNRLENFLIVYWNRFWALSEDRLITSYFNFFPLRKKSFGNLLRNIFGKF